MSKMFSKHSEKIILIKKVLKEFFFSFAWLGIILLIVDQITKVCAEAYLVEGEKVVIIPSLLNFTLTYNTGAAWGMGGNEIWSRILLCAISWIVMIIIFYILIRYYKKLNLLYRAILMLILAGDIGNLIDRTFFFNRGVIDFLDITPLIPGFGIFNFADSCLVVGIIILIIYFIVEYIKELVKEGKANRKALENSTKNTENPAKSVLNNENTIINDSEELIDDNHKKDE